MKLQRSLIISFLLLGSSAAMAATTDVIPMTGTVASTLLVACSETAGASTLAFDGTGEMIVKVSDCNATTNENGGLTVTFDPDANFVSLSGADVFAYAVESVIDAASAPPTGVFPANGVDDTWVTGVSGVTDADVYIRFTADANADPGTYTASIAVTVADN